VNATVHASIEKPQALIQFQMTFKDEEGCDAAEEERAMAEEMKHSAPTEEWPHSTARLNSR
jgi:hypothetical protein